MGVDFPGDFVYRPSFVYGPSFSTMSRRLLLSLVLTTAVSPLALAQEQPLRSAERLEALGIKRLELPAVDLEKARLDDERRVMEGEVPHFAVALATSVTPWDDKGRWDLVAPNEARWRLAIESPGALSLSLAFGRFQMPEGGRLEIYSADGKLRAGPFTAKDNAAHHELWTPPIETDFLLLQVVVPVEGLDLPEELDLRLDRVNHGYAGFGAPQPRSGQCQRDVACAETGPWQDVARSVALVSIEGVRFCTGFLVNNTRIDGQPLFVTAYHCGVDAANAASVVVMWNYSSPICDEEGTPEPELDLTRQFQTGAVLRAAYEPSDFVLLELADKPDPAWGVYYAGWDRTDALPQRVAAIHHPNTDRKRISFDYDGVVPTPYLERERFDGSDHLRVVTWEVGTTEGGSSGAPLFNQDQRVVGQLHGGYAACGNGRSDWFGRLFVSWDGGGTPETRLKDWLDPIASEATVLDGLDASALPE